MLTALLWGGSFAAGILWQWRSPRTAEPWNKRIFNFYFHFFDDCLSRSMPDLIDLIQEQEKKKLVS